MINVHTVLSMSEVPYRIETGLQNSAHQYPDCPTPQPERVQSQHPLMFTNALHAVPPPQISNVCLPCDHSRYFLMKSITTQKGDKRARHPAQEPSLSLEHKDNIRVLGGLFSHSQWHLRRFMLLPLGSCHLGPCSNDLSSVTFIITFYILQLPSGLFPS